MFGRHFDENDMLLSKVSTIFIEHLRRVIQAHTIFFLIYRSNWDINWFQYSVTAINFTSFLNVTDVFLLLHKSGKERGTKNMERIERKFLLCYGNITVQKNV